MAWYYVVNGASLGPVDDAAMQNLRRQNVIVSETPVWTQGMAEWAPFERSTLASTAVVGAPTGSKICAECGKPFPEDEMLQYENAWVCPTCKPIFFQRMREGVKLAGELTYASVGRRFVAILLDGIILILILLLPLGILIGFMGASIRSTSGSAAPAMPGWFMPIILILEYGVPAAYEIFFIGRYGATPGKMIMKIKVTNPEGGPISYGRSTGRYFAKMLSAIILYIGFLMAFWDDEKRALHDRICETRVVATPQV